MSFQRCLELQSEAIILRVRTIGEDDLWVDFLTSDHGRLHGTARHGRKSQKRFGTVLETLNVVRLRFRETGSLVGLEEAGLADQGHCLDKDLGRLVSAFYLIELVRELVPERNPDPKVYTLLKESLTALELASGGASIEDVVMNFEYHLLDLCGYTPHLKKCLACGKARSRAERFFFVYSEGGVFCPACLPRSSSGGANPLGGAEPLSRETLPTILSRFIEYQLGHSLRSRKFLTDSTFCG